MKNAASFPHPVWYLYSFYKASGAQPFWLYMICKATDGERLEYLLQLARVSVACMSYGRDVVALRWHSQFTGSINMTGLISL